MRKARRQRIIRADDESIRSIGLHEMRQHSPAMRDYIEVELICVTGRRPRNRVAALRHQPISHIESPHQRGQSTAGMIQHDSQVRMALEYAAVNQQRGSKAGVVKIADQVAEKISGQSSSRRRFKWMNAN